MRTFLTLFLSFFVSVALHAQTATQSVIYPFKDADGDDPSTSLIQASDGNYYGAAPSSGAYGGGTIYQITPAGVFTTIHDFNSTTDGASPQWIIQGSDGFLYGMTNYGGANEIGTIFKMSLSGQITVLHSFATNDGGNSDAGLTLGADGNFYGVTTNGGSASGGTVFQLTPTGTYTVLYSFTGALDGGNPYGSMIQASDGNLYGITANGGGKGGGTIFQISPTGAFKVFYALDPAVTGTGIEVSLVEGADGALYGTSLNGGTAGDGSIFRLGLDGTLSTLYSFTGGTDGSTAWSPLSIGSDGNFYGSTTDGSGTVYRLTPGGTLTTLYSFTGKTDGRTPRSTLLQGSDGNLYGVAAFGGQYTDGNVYKLTFSPVLNPPVTLTPSSTSVPLGGTATLSWSVSNAFSLSMQQCFATVLSGADASWTGVLTGKLANNIFSGSVALSPAGEGSVTYALTCGGIETGSVTVTVTAPLPVSVTTTSLPVATVGSAYTTTLAATGGVAPYTWSASGLPAGITLSSKGVLSGTATTYGVYPLAITVSDSEGTPLTATASLSLSVTSAAPTVLASPASIAISAPGASGSTSLSLSGFSSSTIALTCSGLPHDATCTFGSVTGSGAAATASVSILTAAPATAALRIPAVFGGNASRIMLGLLFPGAGLLASLFGRRRRLPVRALLVFGAAVLTLGLISGCSHGGSSGSGSSSAPPPDQGTPTGMSSVTITATSGSQTATTTITLNVQ